MIIFYKRTTKSVDDCTNLNCPVLMQTRLYWELNATEKLCFFLLLCVLQCKGSSLLKNNYIQWNTITVHRQVVSMKLKKQTMITFKHFLYHMISDNKSDREQFFFLEYTVDFSQHSASAKSTHGVLPVHFSL